MKNEGLGLFANFFSSKGNVETEQTSTGVTATSSAQPHVLREKMKEQQLTHGATVKANLSPVRLEYALGNAYLYFCPMNSVEVLEKITAGDGGEIPADVTVEGLTVPTEHRSGLYILKNVTLSSNGTMQVRATENTTWEKVS
jgi:hypothetical protein